MSVAINRRRGTTAEHAGFTGIPGEITIDTTKDTVVVHDGVQAGGYPLLREDASNNGQASTVRTNLGLGDSATKNVGTGSGDVAAGNHNHTGVYEPADATILKSATIGVTVQGYDVDTAKLDVDQSWSGSQRATPVTDADGSFDMNAANDFLCTPGGTITLVFTNYVQGQRGSIYLNNTSNHQVNITASRLIAPTGTTTALSATGKYWISYWCVDATASAEVVLISVSPALS